MRNSKQAKAWIRLILFLLGIVVINQVLTFLLVPPGRLSRWVQHYSVTPENSYDLITFGASESMRSWNSQKADEILGIHTYNAGGSAISLEGGIYATFRDTMERQNPDRVIFIVGRFEMAGYKEGTQAYTVVTPYLSDKKNAVEYFFRMLPYGGVLKRLFPWSEYHTDSLQGIKYNVRSKTSKAYLEYDTSFLSDETVVYRGQGFCPYTGEEVIAYDNLDMTVQKSFVSTDVTFAEEKIKMVKKIIDYCLERDCDVVFLAAPVAVTSIASYSYYDSQSMQLKELVEAEGGKYYDLNYAKPELYNPQLDDYYDVTHVNEKGAERFTIAACNLLQKVDAGEDVSTLFYSTWEEYVNSIDYVVATYMTTEEENDRLMAQAHIISGGNTVPEYQFVLHDTESGLDEVLQEFSELDTLEVPEAATENDNLVLRVYARARGETDSEKVRYYDLTDSK